MRNQSFENNLVVDNRKETRALLYSAGLQGSFPTLGESFQQIDQIYEADKEASLQRLVENRFTIKPAANGPGLDASVIADAESAKSNQALLVYAPFSDVAPQSTAEIMARYIEKKSPGFADKNKAKPHSWNQSTKSAAMHDLFKAEGHAMPVITIFSPIPTGAFSGRELKNFRKGNFSASSQVAELAFKYTQDLLHGPSSETQINKYHFYGASLGASNAIGSAARFAWHQEVKSVTTQELILGLKNRVDLLKRFTWGATIGNPTTEELYTGSTEIAETTMRRDADAHGYELAMFAQMGSGMLKLSYLKGLTRAECTKADVKSLAREGVPVTVATANNSGLTEHTEEHLKEIETNKHLIRIRGIQGEKADHLINEHVALSATIALIGISKATAA